MMTGLRRPRRNLHTNVQMRLVFVAQIRLDQFILRVPQLTMQLVNSRLA